MARRVDQDLARVAVDALRGRKVDDELRTRMRGLPALLQTSGLAATCAFLLSRAKERDDAYWCTAKTLLDEAATAVGVDPATDPRATLDTLTGVTEQQYVLAETRAAMLALWLSRLAQAKAEAQQRDRS
ncbi:MAG: type III-B CRISPR module-associated protein Cmr5 [Pseudonocardiaceae bacterium]